MIKDIFKVEVPLEQSMCDPCKRENQDYYQLKVQIRFKHYNEEEMDNLAKKMFKELNKITDINNIVVVDEAIDLYIKYHSHIERISQYFKENYVALEKRSKKLTGRDNLVSKDMFRYFMSIILVNIRKGSKISFKGENYLIYNIDRDTLLVKEELKGKKSKILFSKNIEYITIL